MNRNVDPIVIEAELLARRFERPGGDGIDVIALDDVCLRVAAGEWLAVMGPSGCGKSTLLHVLGGLDRPDSGRVIIDGVDISRLSESARARFRRTRVGYMFQQYNLVPELDVAANIALPLRLGGVRRRVAEARARALLADFALADLLHADPATLSGGEQQRIALARALVARPAVVLADEPTGALDSASAVRVVQALRRARDTGTTIVMVTHDPDVAGAADRVVTMRDGRLELDRVLAGAAGVTG